MKSRAHQRYIDSVETALMKVYRHTLNNSHQEEVELHDGITVSMLVPNPAHMGELRILRNMQATAFDPGADRALWN